MATSIWLYVPNLIGYARIVFAVYALSVSLRSPVHCIVLYFASFVCDELDGRFARLLDQTSTLGAVIDMVTDRMATTGLLLILAVLYPDLLLLFLVLIFLDIFSHWFQMYATLLVGAVTHKDTASASWLVRKYYQHRFFMGFCCVCCEVLYLAAYGLAFPGPRSWRVLSGMGITLPPQLTKLLPGLQLVAGPQGVSILAVLALIALPGSIIKQICNWAQLRASAAVLVAHDMRKRT
ncbi:phosphatidylinositol synthase [Dunaliella salina]|uniref:CDP-diacylglycerol--inositol 3-phosphatidyltransferase n=1 Tax=Dunaliella salina TaxID=3046 RepID=A0ABQ7GG09_DUNSA|nr:phosphatidylinositol synthase [Dunaliella salina]|eukprot:KAF5833534.1 phosphatidylinositol synthase [Dunaliella salina]